MTPVPHVHAGLMAWVSSWINHLRPAAVRWSDGSATERTACLEQLAAAGVAERLDERLRPGSWLVRTDPSDTARVEDRTFIASATQRGAGPLNTWAEPEALRAQLRDLTAGAMAGRTLWVIPFLMGPADCPITQVGVQLTDSPYVVASMSLMTRVGAVALRRLGHDGTFIPCVHALGAPGSSAAWPCEPVERKFIAHFPETREIISFGSGYGGNALLGKKCLALRIASVLAREQGWLAEHMLILALTSPQGRTHYLAAAFPSACGKTNLAMLRSTLPGWTVRCLGDDIAWLRVGADGRLYAVNPEAGFFGVAPGTSPRSNPAAVAMVAREAIFTNCLLTPERDVWWEGLGEPPPSGTDWRGRAWTPGGEPGAHPNARFTVAATGCPVLDPRWDDPEGVPLSAILFGGRRAGLTPLVAEAADWDAGVDMGLAVASETTAAAMGATGVLRRDPFAMRPFCGYHLADYVAHWRTFGARLGANAPRIFTVNWFRRDAAGRFLWPGFGENVRVLKWIAERCDGSAAAVPSPMGLVPAPDALDLHGLDLAPETLRELTHVDPALWAREQAERAAFVRDYATG